MWRSRRRSTKGGATSATLGAVNPRVRRLLAIVTAAGVLVWLFTLGQARGWGLVAQVGARVVGVALVAFAGHVVAHELAHFALARAMNFEVRALRFGPVVVDLVNRKLALAGPDLGGGVVLLPRGVERLTSRLRLVAAAGPLMTASLTLLTWTQWSAREGYGSTTGIALVMGAYVLLTSLLPGVLLPRSPASGTDLEQLIASRRVLAHWTHLAVLQGLSHGAALAQVGELSALEALLPPREAPAEPLLLVVLIRWVEVGRVALVRERLTQVELTFAPEWLVGDLALLASCFFALVDGDAVLARSWLAVAHEHQSQPWFSLLAEAALAQLEARPSDALARWREHLETFPFKAVALGANRWVLDRLQG